MMEIAHLTTEPQRNHALESRSVLGPLLERLDYQEGEKRLMLAVLKDAVGCIERYETGQRLQGWPACRAALRWVLSHDRTWPFSFENICLALDLDPTRLRSALCSPIAVDVLHGRGEVFAGRR